MKTQEEKFPTSVWHLFWNEGVERYAYYALRSILVIFMTKAMLMSGGGLDLMTEPEARATYHMFAAANYFFPILGAILADALIGKYMTVLSLSFVYSAGCAVLAVNQTRTGMYVGLALIAIGSGGIKPCMTAMVGDQFTKDQESLANKAIQTFYWFINAGALSSPLVSPWLLENYGSRWAFGVPAVLMLGATAIFYAGKKKYKPVKVEAREFFKELVSRESLISLGSISVILLIFFPAYFALYDQSGSSWVLQAEKMGLRFLGIEWLPAQLQVVNPLLILMFIPTFEKWVYPFVARFVTVTDLRRMGAGMFLMAATFVITIITEVKIADGHIPNISWQLGGYVILTVSEVLLYGTGLQFFYKQAPPRLKSVVFSLFMLSISLGNVFTAAVNKYIENPSPSFTPDVAGEYVVALRVSDGKSTAKDEVAVKVEWEKSEDQMTATEKAEAKKAAAKARKEAIAEQLKKKTVVISAGNPVAVKPGETANIYGGFDKRDSKGGHKYSWGVTLSPSGSRATLIGKDDRIARFTPDMAGTYILAFRVKMGDGDEATSFVTVEATNQNSAPVASAGMDQTVSIKPDQKDVVLDGSGTYDPDRKDKLTYEWTIVKAPSGSAISNASIKSANVPVATPKLTGVSYYVFFTVMMLVMSVLFLPVAYFYKPKTYFQGDAVAAPASPQPPGETPTA